MWLIKRELFSELFHNPFSRVCWICGVLAIAGVGILLIQAVFPAFPQELLRHKEEEAVHLAQHILHDYRITGKALSQTNAPPEIRKHLALLHKDLKLYKIRLFNRQGIILYSTLAAEEGTRHAFDYFVNSIAKGNTYSKLTRKNHKSLEGKQLFRDVVETYVPIQENNTFVGAIEIYSDITQAFSSMECIVNYLESITIVLAAALICGLTLLFLAYAKQKTDAKKEQLLMDDMEQIMRHDLKAPLSAVINGLNLLSLQEEESPKNEPIFQELKKTAYRMLHSIDSSLILRKIESGAYTGKMVPVDIPTIVDDIKTDLAESIQKKQLSVVTRQKQTQNGFAIPGDHTLLYSILANLLKNAVEASPRQKEISITLIQQENDRMIAITNNGAVPHEIRKTFFEKYVTAQKTGGTGFGTYAARLMTEIQGGTIRLECNDETQTTTLYVAFPNENTPREAV